MNLCCWLVGWMLDVVGVWLFVGYRCCSGDDDDDSVWWCEKEEEEETKLTDCSKHSHTHAPRRVWFYVLALFFVALLLAGVVSEAKRVPFLWCWYFLNSYFSGRAHLLTHDKLDDIGIYIIGETFLRRLYSVICWVTEKRNNNNAKWFTPKNNNTSRLALCGSIDSVATIHQELIQLTHTIGIKIDTFHILLAQTLQRVNHS